MEEEFNADDKIKIKLNAQAMNLLYCGLDPSKYNKISLCDSEKKIQDKLEVAHEGTSQVKKSKISLLVHSYKMFKMLPHENISQMFTHFTLIINSLKNR